MDVDVVGHLLANVLGGIALVKDYKKKLSEYEQKVKEKKG